MPNADIIILKQLNLQECDQNCTVYRLNYKIKGKFDFLLRKLCLKLRLIF